MRLNIAAIPLNIVWADPAKNLANVENYLERLRKDTDLVVLPELFSTGYVQDPKVLKVVAESVSGSTMKAVSDWAKRFNIAVVGSFLCNTGGHIYNRAFFVEPSGEEIFYDKRHLFSLSLEQRLYTQGDALPPVVRFRGWSISMIVCYDLRFPVWCRNMRQSYDLMVVPANWPQSRGYAWKQLLSARAIENQAVYVGADRSGEDDYGCYDDMTFIFDALGKQIETKDESTGIVYASIDKDVLTDMRKKLPFGKDADDFNIQLL